MGSPTDDLRDMRSVGRLGAYVGGIERAVILALILHRNGDTGRCNPSLTTLATWTGFSRRSVVRALDQLEAKHAISRTVSRGSTTSYVIHTASATQTLVPDSHQCHTDTRLVPHSPPTSATVAPERTKERTKERTDVEQGVESPIGRLWKTFSEWASNGNGSKLKLTAGRRKVLKLLWTEQLKNESDPIALFSGILDAVGASTFHMQNRAYHMPESLFRNEDKRDRWTNEGRDRLAYPSSNGASHRMTQAEVWEEEKRWET